MTQQTRWRRIAVLAASVILTLSGQVGTFGRVAAASALECEGAACAQVTLTFDEAKGKYRVQNNSADAWVRVSASNMAASAEVCVAPGKADHLSLRGIVGTYKVSYDSTCGGGDGTR
jgi:hypothetical protein